MKNSNDEIILELDKLKNASMYGEDADKLYALTRDIVDSNTLAVMEMPSALGVLRGLVKVMNTAVNSQEALIKIIAAIPKVNIVEDFI